MTDFIAEASDVDLAGQSVRVNEATEDLDVPTDDFSASVEADPADLFEQQQSVPVSDDDYPVGDGGW